VEGGNKKPPRILPVSWGREKKEALHICTDIKTSPRPEKSRGRKEGKRELI